MWREDYLWEAEPHEQDIVAPRRLLPIHCLTYDVIQRQGGSASFSHILREISPLFPMINSRRVPYTSDPRIAINRILRGALFKRISERTWGVNEEVAALHAKRLSADSITAMRKEAVLRVNEARKREETGSTRFPGDLQEDLQSLVLYSISMHGGSASLPEIVKDVEGIVTETTVSATGRKSRPTSLLTSIETMLQGPQFRHRFGKWYVAPEAMESEKPKKRATSSELPVVASPKFVEMPLWTNGNETPVRGSSAKKSKGTPAAELKERRIEPLDQDVEQFNESRSSSSLQGATAKSPPCTRSFAVLLLTQILSGETSRRP